MPDQWVIYSLIAFTTTLLATLFTRKLHLIHVSFKLQVSVQFIIPFLFFLIWGFSEPALIKINFFHLFLIFIHAIIFVQIGTILSVKSITLAKNPGYASAISRINVFIVTLASIFLFHSYLSLMTLIAILMVMIFSSLILDYSSRDIKDKNNLWFWYALGGGILTSGYALGSKYFISENIPLLTRMFYSFLAMSLVASFDLYINRERLKIKEINKEKILFLLGLGLVTFLFNIFAQRAFELAPNPGFVNVFIATSLVPVTILSVYFFKDEFNLRKILGIVGVLIGLILLYLYS